MEHNYTDSEIIVMDGVITSYGVVKALVSDCESDTEIRLANAEELIQYYKRPDK